jgi:hypothetical protein
MNALARFAACASVLFALLAPGCSSQSEGQRCDQPSDCETGLSCNMDRICCPVSGLSSVAACNPGFVMVVIDAGSDTSDASPDTSDGASADTGPDAQEDAAAEADAATAE